MSNPDQPLTRRQLKELRRTGQLPVITEEDTESTPASGASSDAPEPVGPAAAEGDAAPKAPDAPTSGAAEGPASESDAEQPLTRKQARARRIATNQIPVVPDAGVDEQPHVVLPAGFESAQRDDTAAEEPADDAPAAAPGDKAGAPAAESWASRALREAEQDEAAEAEGAPAEPGALKKAAKKQSKPAPAPRQDESADDVQSAQAPAGQPTPAKAAAAKADDLSEAGDRPQVGSSFGAAVFQQAEERQRAEREQAEREAAARREAKSREAKGEAPADGDAPGPGTGEIAAEAYSLSQDSSGSTAGNTSSLILKDMPGAAALSAPITATGELIMTSSHSLPEGLGAHGAAKGTTDGKDVDDVLIDGELPEHSSPTPIAASRAVSTSKAPGDVIRPPAPEKNRGLMLALGITAGVLGLALIGVVVYVFATGQLN
ncbi:hypothetical protein [Microbacterium halophytorum]|uniref:hypothetical protein n=1 Tax=Microbacterium halophytorum TaxID=2067568 RepID=UPI000CFAB3DB|nr:hypothetical protein [Microbacterium halophytorum]